MATGNDTERQAPVDDGISLAVITRSETEELRVTLSEYRGHQFLSLRVWARNPEGMWLPVGRKGVSVRLREAEQVADALVRGAALAEA